MSKVDPTNQTPECPDCKHEVLRHSDLKCTHCGSLGYILDCDCPTCKGTGQVSQTDNASRMAGAIDAVMERHGWNVPAQTPEGEPTDNFVRGFWFGVTRNTQDITPCDPDPHSKKHHNVSTGDPCWCRSDNCTICTRCGLENHD